MLTEHAKKILRKKKPTESDKAYIVLLWKTQGHCLTKIMEEEEYENCALWLLKHVPCIPNSVEPRPNSAELNNAIRIGAILQQLLFVQANIARTCATTLKQYTLNIFMWAMIDQTETFLRKRDIEYTKEELPTLLANSICMWGTDEPTAKKERQVGRQIKRQVEKEIDLVVATNTALNIISEVTGVEEIKQASLGLLDIRILLWDYVQLRKGLLSTLKEKDEGIYTDKEQELIKRATHSVLPELQIKEGASEQNKELFRSILTGDAGVDFIQPHVALSILLPDCEEQTE